MSTDITLRLTLNGQPVECVVDPTRRVLDLLREDLGLTGSKEGCGEGECGACAVLLDGAMVNSCLLLAGQLQDAALRTIEGLPTDDPLFEAFARAGATQCGICTPGMVVAARALLDREPAPSRERIREALAGNLCRCTGYVRILDAVEAAARVPSGRAS
ncbi:MAG: (2Fe-2S)-binding protein [Pseudomonadota bacterium]|jgi:carbon-monoxide dehydrogenase small subunit